MSNEYDIGRIADALERLAIATEKNAEAQQDIADAINNAHFS